jgi:hypothetical protein
MPISKALKRSGLLLILAAVHAQESSAPLLPTSLTPSAADAQRLQALAQEESFLRARFDAIQIERDLIKTRTCYAAEPRVKPEQCGDWTSDGKVAIGFRGSTARKDNEPR